MNQKKDPKSAPPRVLATWLESAALRYLQVALNQCLCAGQLDLLVRYCVCIYIYIDIYSDFKVCVEEKVIGRRKENKNRQCGGEKEKKRKRGRKRERERKEESGEAGCCERYPEHKGRRRRPESRRRQREIGDERCRVLTRNSKVLVSSRRRVSSCRAEAGLFHSSDDINVLVSSTHRVSSCRAEAGLLHSSGDIIVGLYIMFYLFMN
ncbi:uncharacterized protein LOC132296426 [Cornus florida]|uniref:uncharacterized protein LOC132296426 n=1 Tax=Cornus florida TaxID=4283 RepID=UPI00289E3F62|nr:uncharacterized protein LOC132296426 [Cornus florida]